MQEALKNIIDERKAVLDEVKKVLIERLNLYQEPQDIDEDTPPQLFYANTRDLPKGGYHYHVKQDCRALVFCILHEKQMCLHCKDAQQMTMLVLRLDITRPYEEQLMAQRVPGTPSAAMILLGGQTG